MLSVTGKVVRQDLGPGAWVLESPDGQRFALQGGNPQAHAGQVVTVTGELNQGAVGIGMLGAPVLSVRGISAVARG